MHVIEQLAENKFVVEMDEKDLNLDTRVVIAHDYVLFGGQKCECTNFRPTGKYAMGNCIHHFQHVQIDIRMMQDILKILENHKFLQPEHITGADGSPKYMYSGYQEYRYRNSEGTDMVAVMDNITGKFTHMTLTVYNSLKELFKASKNE